MKTILLSKSTVTLQRTLFQVTIPLEYVLRVSDFNSTDRLKDALVLLDT